jgi:hypothetical protein
MLYLIPRYADQTKSGIDLCLRSRLVVPAITLLYSGIDVLGFLASAKPHATRQTFILWAEKHLDCFLKTKGICGLDLYSARCGLLHTGQAPSAHVDSGDARELWYRFDGEAHINMMTNTPKPAVLVDVEELVESFKGGIERLMSDVEADPNLRTEAERKAERYFRTGILIGPR